MIKFSNLKTGIGNIINMTPDTEKKALIAMIESCNPLNMYNKKYIIPLEMYCDLCNIRYVGYDYDNIKKSLERLDIHIAQRTDGTILSECKLDNGISLFHLLNTLEIIKDKEIIRYSFHNLLIPYIIAYHAE